MACECVECQKREAADMMKDQAQAQPVASELAPCGCIFSHVPSCPRNMEHGQAQPVEGTRERLNVRRRLAEFLCDLVCGETHICYSAADKILRDFPVTPRSTFSGVPSDEFPTGMESVRVTPRAPEPPKVVDEFDRDHERDCPTCGMPAQPTDAPKPDTLSKVAMDAAREIGQTCVGEMGDDTSGFGHPQLLRDAAAIIERIRQRDREKVEEWRKSLQQAVNNSGVAAAWRDPELRQLLEHGPEWEE